MLGLDLGSGLALGLVGIMDDHPPHIVQACLALFSPPLHPILNGQLGTCPSLCTPGPLAGRRAT